MVGGIVYKGEETGFGKSELESAEFGGEELNYFGRFWGRNENRVDAMDNPVGTELS